MHNVLQDFSLAFRILRKRPTASLVIILTLALGIGANTTFFASFYGMVMRPLPFEDPDMLVSLNTSRPALGESWNAVSAPDYRDWIEQSDVFDGAGAYRWASFNLSSGDQPEHLTGAAIEASLFPMLGVTPQLGRNISPSEDLADGPKVVLISDEIWQRRFASDPRVLGATLRIDDEPWEIIGVMPRDFHFPNEGQVWTPLALDPRTEARDQRRLSIIARLAPGWEASAAQTALQPLANRLASLYPESNRGWSINVRDLHDAWLPPVTQLASAAQVVLVLGVLLIVCANVASVTLAQASARQQEMALRAALGAGRRRLARLALTESMLLALAGGGVGLLVSTWGETWMQSISAVTIPYWLRFNVDGPIVAFGLVITLFTGVLVGMLPAIKGTGHHLFESLRNGGRSEDPSKGRLRQSLVVMEYAITLVVLVAGLLMAQSFENVRAKDQGFATENILTFRVALTGNAYDAIDPRRSFYEQMLDGLKAIPEINSAGMTSHLPISFDGFAAADLEAEGNTSAEDSATRATFEAVSQHYLETLRIPMLEGRAFNASEIRQGTPVVVVSQALAEQLWPGQEAVGRRLRSKTPEEGPWHRVVGVVGNVAPGQMLSGIDVYPTYQAYTPWSRVDGDVIDVPRQPVFTIATHNSPETVVASVRQLVQQLDPGLPVFEVLTMGEVLNRFYFAQKIWSQMFSAIAFLALMIAAVGAYGVTTYTVSRRTREMGIRLALGSDRWKLLTLVMRQGVLLSVCGVGLGLLAAVPMATTMGNLLHGMRALDPGIFGIVVSTLLGVGLLASFAPAWRAVHQDPLTILREE